MEESEKEKKKKREREKRKRNRKERREREMGGEIGCSEVQSSLVRRYDQKLSDVSAERTE